MFDVPQFPALQFCIPVLVFLIKAEGYLHLWINYTVFNGVFKWMLCCETGLLRDFVNNKCRKCFLTVFLWHSTPEKWSLKPLSVIHTGKESLCTCTLIKWTSVRHEGYFRIQGSMILSCANSLESWVGECFCREAPGFKLALFKGTPLCYRVNNDMECSWRQHNSHYFTG